MFQLHENKDIVMCITIARQRLGKDTPVRVKQRDAHC
jgi:hypothetical protein